MLLEKVIKYYSGSYSLNCAEAMLYAANDEYNLLLSKKALKTMAAFGGGMGVEETCGAITGGLAVLGILFVNDKAHESNRIKLLSRKYIDSFKARLKSYTCKELKSLYREDESKCMFIMETAAAILEEVIKNEIFG